MVNSGLTVDVFIADGLLDIVAAVKWLLSQRCGLKIDGVANTSSSSLLASGITVRADKAVCPASRFLGFFLGFKSILFENARCLLLLIEFGALFKCFI